jgi:hypothetical protein
MSTTEHNTEQADREELLRAIVEKRKPDPEVVKRVRQRSEELRAKMPTLPAGTCVELIRSGRDE